MPRIATSEVVGRDALLDFLRTRHHAILSTKRRDGSAQLSPVTCGLDAQHRIVIATYPSRAKTHNIRRNPAVSLCVLSDVFEEAYVQVDGQAEVLNMPAALDGLVDYYRGIAGEHPDWEEYRQAMVRQNKSLVRIRVDRWGPIATGGLPPEYHT